MFLAVDIDRVNLIELGFDEMSSGIEGEAVEVLSLIVPDFDIFDFDDFGVWGVWSLVDLL